MTNEMIKPVHHLLFLICLCFASFNVAANSDSGLLVEKPGTLHIIYTIEPAEFDPEEVHDFVEAIVAKTVLTTGKRDDARLFVRVEKHAGSYLLYLDFNRRLNYSVDGNTYTTTGFVWGRYAKNITDQSELFDDLQFLLEEFIQLYLQANELK